MASYAAAALRTARLAPDPDQYIPTSSPSSVPSSASPRDASSRTPGDASTPSEEDAFDWARRLMTEEGIFAGISTGGNVAVAARLAALPENHGKTIVTIWCSFGERYLSTPLFERYSA